MIQTICACFKRIQSKKLTLSHKQEKINQNFKSAIFPKCWWIFFIFNRVTPYNDTNNISKFQKNQIKNVNDKKSTDKQMGQEPHHDISSSGLGPVELHKRPRGHNLLTCIFANAMQQSSIISTATGTQIWPYHKRVKGHPSLVILRRPWVPDAVYQDSASKRS